jgi:hypothetical protein
MKLAFVNASIVRLDAVRGVALRSRSAANIPLRTASDSPRKARHSAGRLAAHWHVSPETGRVECRWSVEEAPADDSLCRHVVRSRSAQADRDRAA